MAAAHQLGHFLEEEGHQQGRDVGAVDVGVGHDDDPLVAQRILVELVAGAAAEREAEVGDFAVGADLVGGGGGDVEDLAADREDRLGLAVARLLGRAAGAVALDDEQLGALGVVVGAVGELAGQAELARGGRGLALDLALGAALAGARPSARRSQPSSARPRSMLSARKWSKWSRTAASTKRAASRLVRRSLVWLWKCGLRMNTQSISSTPLNDVVGGDVLGLLVADQLAERADALGQRGAQARLRGCRRRASGWCCSNSFRCRRTRAARRPPIRRVPWLVGEVLAAGERLVGDARAVAELLGEMVGKAAGELEDGVSRGRRRWRATGRSASGSRPRRRDRPWSGRACRAAPGSNAASAPKISGSGVKVTVVPRRLGAAPTSSSFEVGDARARRPGGRASCRARPRRWSRSTAR